MLAAPAALEARTLQAAPGLRAACTQESTSVLASHCAWHCTSAEQHSTWASTGACVQGIYIYACTDTWAWGNTRERQVGRVQRARSVEQCSRPGWRAQFTWVRSAAPGAGVPGPPARSRLQGTPASMFSASRRRLWSAPLAEVSCGRQPGTQTTPAPLEALQRGQACRAAARSGGRPKAPDHALWKWGPQVRFPFEPC